MLSAFIFYTVLFFALLVLPAGLILVALLFVEYERRLWQRVTPIMSPVAHRLAGSPTAVDLGRRFPGAKRFLIRRFARRDPWGLPATLAGLVIFAGLWFFLGVLQDLVARDPLVILDIRLHNTVPLFRTPGMTRLMLVFTALGGATVLLLGCMGLALLSLARSRQRLAATFVLALGVTGLISLTLKVLIGSTRPIDALISAPGASFPSGHTLSGTVVYGLLAALLLGSRVRLAVRALGVTLLLLLMVGIGLSRLYLGVHWPSDILGSLALALIVLAALLFFLYYAQPIRWIDTFKLPFTPRTLRIAGNSALVLALGDSALLASQVRTVPVAPKEAMHPLDLQALRVSLPPGLPSWSEDLIGSRMEPVSLVLVGSGDELQRAFARAGWSRADPPTPVRVVREGLAALRNLPDPTGPATPAFFMDQPQDLTFEKPDQGAPSIRRRHHARLWKTQHCLAPDCRPVWVATASFDVGMRFSERLYLPTHRIDAALDNERSLIVSELTDACATREGIVNVTQPMHGRNAAGDPFWTDGRAVVLVMPFLKDCKP